MSFNKEIFDINFANLFMSEEFGMGKIINTKKYEDEVCNTIPFLKKNKCAFISDNDYKQIQKIKVYPNCGKMENVITITARIDNDEYDFHILKNTFNFDINKWKKINNISDQNGKEKGCVIFQYYK